MKSTPATAILLQSPNSSQVAKIPTKNHLTSSVDLFGLNPKQIRLKTTKERDENPLVPYHRQMHQREGEGSKVVLAQAMPCDELECSSGGTVVTAAR
jgi:hypothetical protein